ncbi:UNVERIFIED_CONTAM: hypothetical protein RMT77_000391 [Armadillidium vulgare]
MTEVVDKTLIERLILEHSDRLELEINQKARADAWKFYYRVRVDHVIRPFAVCKVCYRVLHCDSRSGTASLLRHPCNPLSERSPVNRAVKLSAKLNLPTDCVIKNEAFKGDHLKSDLSQQIDSINNASLRQSPVSLVGGGTPTSNCPSPTSTGSPPTTNLSSPLTVPSVCANGGRKRKVGVQPPTFPLDLRLLQIPQMMAAVAAHPLAALNLANATAFLADPQHFHHLQQQQSHLEHILREHHLQQERELKRNREEESSGTPDRNGSLSGEASSSSSPTWGRPRVKKERADTSEETVVGSCEDNNNKEGINHGGRGRQAREDIDDPGGGMNKEMVQHLVSVDSERVQLTEKDSGGSHYISDVWSRFQVVFVDGMLRPFAACKTCKKVVTYTKYSGTGGLLRHRCASYEHRVRDSPQDSTVDPIHESRDSPLIGGENIDLSFKSESTFGAPRSSISSFAFAPNISSPVGTPVRDSHEDNFINPSTPSSTMAGIARALLRYMCHDLIAATTLDSPAFHQLVWTMLNLGASHGTCKEEEPLPTSKQLIQSYLPPMITDSKETISRNLHDQNYLCLSIHCRQVGDTNVLAASVHCITQEFQLQSHALGIKRFYKGESRDEVVQVLVREFFQDLIPPSTLREKYVTVVTDEGDAGILGSTGVKCVWHSVESVLETLTEVVAYSALCDEIRNALAFLADSGVDGVSSCSLKTSEVHRWEALLHAINFIVSHYEELKHALRDSQSSTDPSGSQAHLSDKEIFEEVSDLLMGVRRCLMTVRDFKRPTLNQAVLCRAKLLHLCSSPAVSLVTQQVKEYLVKKLESALVLAPLHLVASFLDPRCKSLKVLNENEKGEVHRLVLDMMKAVSVTEANTGVLNLKTTRRSSSPGPAYSRDSVHSDSAQEIHPFSEYMDNPGTDLSVSDSEEIMAYVNMKVHLDNDDILGWWSGPSASGLPTLRRLARKILAVPATCAFACQINAHAAAASEKMGLMEPSQLNNVLYMRYNMS